MAEPFHFHRQHQMSWASEKMMLVTTAIGQNFLGNLRDFSEKMLMVSLTCALHCRH